jgi:hypothetical protein
VRVCPRTLAIAGAIFAAPAFVLNWAAHGGNLPGPDEADRLDGVFSLFFIAGAALVVAALFTSRPSPLGRRGRLLLHPEAVMVALAATWSALLIIDPEMVEGSKNALLLAGDASWPLHQAFMLVIGISAVRRGAWPSPALYLLFGPAGTIVVLAAAMALDWGLLAAVALGAGWTTAAMGVVLAGRVTEARGTAVLHTGHPATA